MLQHLCKNFKQNFEKTRSAISVAELTLTVTDDFQFPVVLTVQVICLPN